MKRRIGTAIVATQSEGHARTDRHMLKQAGASQVIAIERGAAVLERLGEEPVGLVLCDFKLADMSGVELVSSLRGEPRFSRIPVIMAAGASSETDILSAIGAGCHGYVVRPYSIETLSRQIGLALSNAREPSASALMLAKARAMRSALPVETEEIARVQETVSAVSAASPAEDALEIGLTLLVSGRFDAAISAFHRAIRLNAMYGEAHEGLARAWLGKGRKDKYLECMRRAAECYAGQDRFIAVRSLLAEVVKEGGDIGNPYYDLGKRLWQREEYGDAVRAWQKAFKLTPGNPAVARCLARAFCIMGKDDQAESVLATARELTPDIGEMRDLVRALRAEEQETENIPGWLRSLMLPMRRAMARILAA